MKRIDEATRRQLIDKSKGADITKSYGTTRYDRKDMQHIYNSVSAFNKIDMNALWKANLLSFFIPVQGETNNYEVEVLFDGILDAINRELKNNSWTFEYKVVYRAIIDAINKQDIYISCSCLHPDTKIKLLDGTTPSIAEMKDRFDNGEHLWVYSTDKNGDFKPGEVEDVLITKETKDFIKITLDNDEVIITTPDHPYMLRDGSYIEARDLEVGTSLMPLYYNHKIKAIENITLDSNIPVYDIKVKKWHNFLVNAGVILHNCPDWKYRMSYWSSKGRYNSGQPQIVPARITNPADSKGAGCKHVMKVLADLDWALKLASCITNYVTYMEEHYPDKYFDILFPAMYGVSYQRALDQGLIEVPEDDLDAIEVDNLDNEEEIPEESPEPQEEEDEESEDVE